MGTPIGDPLGILNPNLVGPDNWTFPVGWSYVSGAARWDHQAQLRSLFQESVTVHNLCRYRIGLTVLEWSTSNPNAKLNLLVQGLTGLMSVYGVGTFTKVLTSYEDVESGGIIAAFPFDFDIGGYCIIDNFVGYSLGAYAEDVLGFIIPGTKRSELYPGQQAEYSQILASRDGKTNISILFNT